MVAGEILVALCVNSDFVSVSQGFVGTVGAKGVKNIEPTEKTLAEAQKTQSGDTTVNRGSD